MPKIATWPPLQQTEQKKKCERTLLKTTPAKKQNKNLTIFYFKKK